MQGQAIQSEKPLRYISDALISQRALKDVHAEDIDISTKLRQQPTTLNEPRILDTPLYGTAPFVGGGIQNMDTEVNIESDLLFGSTNRFCNRSLTEQQFYRPDNLNIPLVEDSELRGKSTRSDMRNNYKKFNCYKQKN